MGAEVAFGITIGQLLFGAALVAGSAYSYYSAQKQTSSYDDAADHGLRVNTRSTNEPIKVIYGKMRIGGNDVAYASSGTNGNIFWSVQTL